MMKKLMMVTVAAAGLVLVGPAGASDSGAELVKSKKCMTCHDVEKKKAGPAFKATAEKYKADKDAANKIVAALKDAKGHPKVAPSSDDELKAMVTYILSAK